jgi:hypothetical protein
VPTYYTYKTQVQLLPGQTLAFAAGKGYYAAGAAQPVSEHGQGGGYSALVAVQPKSAITPPSQPIGASPSPSPAPSSDPPPSAHPTLASAQPTPSGTRPSAFTAPAPSLSKSSAAPDVVSDAALSHGYGTRYYTHRHDVPLRFGQVLGFTRGRGYYAYYPNFVVPHYPGATPGGPRSPRPPTAPAQPGASGSEPPILATPTGAGFFPLGRSTARVNAFVAQPGLGDAGPQIAVAVKAGAKKEYRLIIQTQFGWVLATIEAEAEVEWAGGAKDASITLSSDGLSIRDGPLTVNDPAFYMWTKRLTHMVSGAQAGQTLTIDPHYDVKVAVGGKQVASTPIGDVNFEGSVTFGPDGPELAGKATADLAKIPMTGGNEVSLTYGIGIKLQPLPPDFRKPASPPDTPPWLVPLAIGLALLAASSPGRVVGTVVP